MLTSKEEKTKAAQGRKNKKGGKKGDMDEVRDVLMDFCVYDLKWLKMTFRSKWFQTSLKVILNNKTIFTLFFYSKYCADHKFFFSLTISTFSVYLKT